MRAFLLTTLGLLGLIASVQAGSFQSWRGPSQNGVAEGTGYPTEWNNKDNVAWKIALPGKGASTPIVVNDQIILTCGVDGKNQVLAFGLDGKQNWSQVVGSEREGKHKKATGSNPSAVAQGDRIWTYFKSGDLACISLKGDVIWQVNLQNEFGKDTLWWDLGTSPVLTENHVVVAVMQSGPSYLVALDKKTGKVAWKHDRELGAPSEAAQSYSTPLVHHQNGNEILVVLGADHVTGHSAADGKELWRVGGLNPKGEMYFRSIASPVVCGDIVVSPYARGSTITGVKLGGAGDVTASHVAWFRDKLGADVPTPAALDGKVYLCTDRGELHCLDGATGKTHWSGAVEKNRNAFSSSPVLADGKIYMTREDGTTFVLKQGDEFKQLAVNQLDDEFVVATPVFANGRIYIRTLEHLYCIGKK